MKTSTILILVIALLVCNSYTVKSQYDCFTENNDTSSFQEKSYLYCNNTDYLSNYYLDRKGNAKYDQSTIYTVRVKIHVMQHSLLEPRNYTIADTHNIKVAFNNVSSKYANIQTPFNTHNF